MGEAKIHVGYSRLDATRPYLTARRSVPLSRLWTLPRLITLRALERIA